MGWAGPATGTQSRHWLWTLVPAHFRFRCSEGIERSPYFRFRDFLALRFTRSGSLFLPVSRFHSSKVFGEICHTPLFTSENQAFRFM